MPGPLHGVVIVEACQMVAGPLAGTLLADLGAEVIKIEIPVGGDRMRYLGDRVGDLAAVWVGVNRGKRSVVLDLQTPDGLAALKTIAARADVFIQNFRPGVADRLGIGEEALRTVRDNLIYVSVSGFGEDGPYSDQKSYDYVTQALSGMVALQTDPETGTPALVRNIVIDKTTAGYAAQSILAALFARERGAGGQHVRLSMLDVALAFLWPDGMMQHTWLDRERVTQGNHIADGYKVYPTLDGHIVLMASSRSQFPGLCRALGTDWETDPRFSTLEDRESRHVELQAEIGERIAAWHSRAIADALHAQDVPCAVVVPLDQVHLDPQAVHNGIVVERQHPVGGPMREIRPPADFSATPAALGLPAPGHDEHTDEVLAEVGYDPEAIAALRASGAVGARRRQR